MQSTSSEYQWFLLKKDFFGFNADIYVCWVYFPPRNSTYNTNCVNNHDLFEQINVDMTQHSKHGKILICGDINARTGNNEPDFILNDDSSYIPLSENYLQDNSLECRISQDKVIDARGRDLLDLCVESQMRILNGRTFGDTQGMFTSYKYNGSSVVDYMITSESLLSQILYFNVSLNKPRLSDHSKISCKIMANIIFAAADVSLKKKITKRLKKRQTSKKWYDCELYKMHRMLDQKGYLYAECPSDPFVRGSYYKFRNLYVKSCKREDFISYIYIWSKN